DLAVGLALEAQFQRLNPPLGGLDSLLGRLAVGHGSPVEPLGGLVFAVKTAQRAGAGTPDTAGPRRWPASLQFNKPRRREGRLKPSHTPGPHPATPRDRAGSSDVSGSEARDP